MNLYLRLFFGAVLLLSIPDDLSAKNALNNSTNKLYFLENKGQVTDQNGKPRTDIQFVLPSSGMTLFIGNGTLHYQFMKLTQNGLAECLKNSNINSPEYFDEKLNKMAALSSAEIQTYRMDVQLVGANPDAEMVVDEKQAYYENYYLPGCLENGCHAHTYNKITYRNIYDGIDWVIYIKGNKLEHEFLVKKGGDASQIKIEYKGQTNLKLNADGSIVAITPMGEVREKAPICYSSKNGINDVIPSSYAIEGDILSYIINAPSESMVIDPTLEWGTYYGLDSFPSPAYGVSCDRFANVFMAGLTYSSSTIATTGSYQYTYGGSADAYLVKFDSSGNRLWGTYYGGSQGDWANAICVSYTGSIYLSGTTISPGLATAGAAQATLGGGGWDAFVAKLDENGFRQWCTYLGGNGSDYGASIFTDRYGHVLTSGNSNSVNNIGTVGSYQRYLRGGIDCYLVQYDTLGTKIFGTYVGGTANDFGGAGCSDGLNYYVAAWTASTSTGMTTPGTYHETYGGGGSDAYVIKFDNAGGRVWSSYYGGTGSEGVGGITCDLAGQIFLLASTTSDSSISTPGCSQRFRAGGVDAYLVKIDNELGLPIWGTFYGGPGVENDDQSRICTDNSGNVYITGFTTSLTGIATTGANQATFGGGDDDGFVAEFTGAGTKLWSTFYGGDGSDEPRACAFDGRGLYVVGESYSTNNIATTGSFKDSFGGGIYYNGFMGKFSDVDTALIPTATNSVTLHSSNFSLFPNPNIGSFTISGTLQKTLSDIQVSVIDISGRVVFTTTFGVASGSFQKTIDLSSTIPQGTYFVRVVTGNEVDMLRFVKD